MQLSELRKGNETAFVNKNNISNKKYQPKFIYNDHKIARKVLTTIEEELLNCDEFIISVAFITMGGIAPLTQTLELLEQRNIKGKILTTDYLHFTDPAALDKLHKFQNIEVRMFNTDDDIGFHTKGYIFRKNDIYTAIVGSSNMTGSALTKNKEWNSRLVSSIHGEYITELFDEFNKLWESEQTKDYTKFIETYRIIYNTQKKQRKIAKQMEVPSIETAKLKPNSMQVEVIKNLTKLYENGAERSLLISATGTGKTFASAFAIKELKPKRFLFIVHREQIAKQALESYKKVFGQNNSFGLLSGTKKDFEVDYLFSTMQSMSKDTSLSKFKEDEFDVIVLDEVHRAGASSYQKIMDYFKPKHWFGMTASPERTDGFDIYTLFNHNIVYEIRLQQALEENLLCPFHYFGITELEINGEVFNEETGTKNFNYLVSDLRVDYILEKADKYGYSGDRVKGLIFCSNKREAKELSDKFNERGRKTTYLSGDDSQEKRELCVDKLVTDDSSDYLEYIFTVDIFNEGVDIPAVNQVIMLRPTESPIVFIQQLGRGLRKYEDKKFVIILDFIGNYTNNFMIPIALSGDKSYNKDTIRRYVGEGTKVIPGTSTVHFDEISKKRIFQSIDSANFSDIKIIKEEYNNLKFKLGKIPSLMDFDNYGSIDVMRIFDNKSLGSYYAFLVKYEKDYTTRFSDDMKNVLEYISKKFASGKRKHELLVLKRLMKYESSLLNIIKEELKNEHGIDLDENGKVNLVNLLSNEFTQGTGKTTYDKAVFIEKSGEDYKISKTFDEMLKDKEFYNHVAKLLDYGLYRNEKDYSSPYKNTMLQLYSKYTYEDVCRLLNWSKGEVALNIGGYKYDKITKTYPVFINYEKSEDISDTTNYEDRFVNPNTLIAISKAGRTVDSEDVQTALRAQELGVEMELFVRKNKEDKGSKEFYYLGKIHATGATNSIIMPNTNKTAVEIEYTLETPIRADIYDYITN